MEGLWTLNSLNGSSCLESWKAGWAFVVNEEAASLNGPKLWMPDWTDIEIGKVQEFNGIKAAWVGGLNVGDE
jgi:hypothetical protein